jgi:hypothetical protein
MVQHHHNGRLANGSCLTVVLFFLLCGGHVWIRLNTGNDLDSNLSPTSLILLVGCCCVGKNEE